MSEPVSPRQGVEALTRGISDGRWDKLDGLPQPLQLAAGIGRLPSLLEAIADNTP